MNSNGKDTGIGKILSSSGFRNTTAMGLLAAGSRAITAPAGPLILPTVNHAEYWQKKETLESPDSFGNDSGGWGNATPPLKQALISSFKNRPLAFPINVETQLIKTGNSTPSTPQRSHRNSNGSTSYRSRPDDNKDPNGSEQQVLQISDYDNLRSELVSD